jgi:hypothetical protein
MKIAGKLAIWILLAVLVALPLRAVQAKGLLDGPIFGQNYTLKSGETLNNDLVVFGGSVSIEKDAKVKGAIALFGGSLIIDGDVSKDVIVMGGAVKLGANSHIHGSLITLGAPLDKDQGAKVDKDVINDLERPGVPTSPSAPSAPTLPGIVDNYTNPLWEGGRILAQALAFALLAMLIALFLPVQLRRVSDGVLVQPFVSFGIGLLTLIVFIVIIVALVLFSVFIVTLFLTIPLTFIVSVLFVIGIVFGWWALGAEIGIRIAQLFKREWPLPLATGLGVFILNIVGSIPCAGSLFSFLVGLAGLGAVFLTRFGTRPAALMATPVVVDSNPPIQNS